MGQDVRLLQLGEPSGELWPQRDGPLLDLHDPGASLSRSLSLIVAVLVLVFFCLGLRPLSHGLSLLLP